jgi:hypothetical protein
MSSPNGEKPLILYDLWSVAYSIFMTNPLHIIRRKRVHFNNTVEYFECISLNEILEHNIKDKMWWNNADYASFRLEMDIDTQRIMYKYPSIDYYSARKILNDPGYNFTEATNE